MQWVSGCIKSVLDLSDSDRTFALTYLSNLLEDASDFGYDNAKACHAVVLSTMEQDKLKWSDTEDLDTLRRQHAQRHGAHSDNVRSSAKRQESHKSESKDLPCKFYNDSRCSRQDTHFTKGIWFYHVCSRCRGSHKVRDCPQSKK